MGNGFWKPTDKRKKSLVGKLNEMMEVTPTTIAYTVSQVHQLFYHLHLFQITLQAQFALSSCKEWIVEDGNFILQMFYKLILELFEDKEGEWVIETLDWWNKYMTMPSLFAILKNIYAQENFPRETDEGYYKGQ